MYRAREVVPSRVGVAELMHDDTTEVHELKELVTPVHQALVHQLQCVCVRERERASTILHNWIYW